MFDLGMQELIVIFLVAFLVFGPKKLPDLARTVGKGLKELRSALSNVKETIEKSELDISKGIQDVKADIHNTINKAVEPEATKETTAAKQPESPVGEKEAASGKEKDG
ncbi:MAG: twin-arginine translocase TatA/TatE family subunit [Nitrospirae bacterium]|nr:twin-arginine translocase TatA/TatE family subunit [Nitrospirota bacterium]